MSPDLSANSKATAYSITGNFSLEKKYYRLEIVSDFLLEKFQLKIFHNHKFFVLEYWKIFQTKKYCPDFFNFCRPIFVLNFFCIHIFCEKFDPKYQCIAAFRFVPVSLFTVRIVCPFLDYPARRLTPASWTGLSGCPVLLGLFIIQPPLFWFLWFFCRLQDLFPVVVVKGFFFLSSLYFLSFFCHRYQDRYYGRGYRNSLL